MRRPKTLNGADYYRDQFVALRDSEDLAELLEVSLYKLKLLSLNPAYRVFYVPKRNGKKRLIEDPTPQLKAIQRRLNLLLQSVYFFHKTEAAYGFVMNARGDGTTRNIFTNAEQHLGCQYLFNADIEDFFHQVSSGEIAQLFFNEPFDFKEELAHLLVALVTNQERLPMGAPTSPVLSNFATIKLDNDLLQLAQWDSWRYTRYADDMSFSSQSPFNQRERDMITKAVEEHGYTFNATKFKYFVPGEEKRVTGLVLGKESVELPKDFMPNLKAEIERLKHVMETMQLSGKRDTDWIDDYEARIEGLLNFAAQVRGEEDREVLKLEKALHHAMRPPDDFGALSWVDFPYF